MMLSSHTFAAGAERDLPTHTPEHTRLSWHLLHARRNYPPSIKEAAAARILEKAQEYGIELPKFA
jgi:hypothetical protein